MPGGRAANYFSVESPAVALRPVRQISLFSLSLPRSAAAAENAHW
jgi:hypothetical protein